MTEAEALRFFLKLICGACAIWIAFAWLVVGLLHRRIRSRRAAREHTAVISIAK